MNRSLPLTMLLAACAPHAPPEPTASDADPQKETWKETAKVSLNGGPLRVEVETTESCCANGQDEQLSSPARFFYGPVDPGVPDGWLVVLGKEDRVVSSRLSAPKTWASEIYRSATATPRENGKVVMEIPADVLPGGQLRVWAATTNPVHIGGETLGHRGQDMVIPYLLLDTGQPEKALPPSPRQDVAPPRSVSPLQEQPAGAGSPLQSEEGAPPGPGREPTTEPVGGPGSPSPAPATSTP